MVASWLLFVYIYFDSRAIECSIRSEVVEVKNRMPNVNAGNWKDRDLSSSRVIKRAFKSNDRFDSTVYMSEVAAAHCRARAAYSHTRTMEHTLRPIAVRKNPA